MARVRGLARLLWLGTAACGRLGFDELSADELPRIELPVSLDLAATCGDLAPPAVDLPITSSGGIPLVIHGAEATQGFVIATALPVTIAPGDAASLAIVPPVAVIGSDLGGSTKTGTLKLFTNAGVREVALGASVIGANLGFVDGGQVVQMVTFASTAGMGCPTPKTLMLVNTGTLAAAVSRGPTSSFLVSVVTGPLAPASQTAVSVDILANGNCVADEPISYTVTGTVCTATPLVLHASFDVTGVPACKCNAGTSPP